MRHYHVYITERAAKGDTTYPTALQTGQMVQCWGGGGFPGKNFFQINIMGNQKVYEKIEVFKMQNI